MSKIKHSVLLFFCTVNLTVFANTKGVTNYEITKHTLSSAGGLISGGSYTVVTSIGQIDAGHNTSGDIYEYSGGFLASLAANNDIIFIDGFE